MDLDYKDYDFMENELQKSSQTYMRIKLEEAGGDEAAVSDIVSSYELSMLVELSKYDRATAIQRAAFIGFANGIKWARENRRR